MYLESNGYYSENDFRNYELYHHGILGMKWGKKQGPPYPLDASDHSAAERKAGWRKSLTNPINREKDRIRGNINAAKGIINNTRNAKGLWMKGQELIGRGAARTIYSEASKMEKNLSEHSSTRLGKRIHDRRAANNKYMADYAAKKLKKSDTLSKAFETAILDDYIMDFDLYNTKYERLSGRTTTRGKEFLNYMLTAGIAGQVLDAKYYAEQRKSNKK